ncbi:hypothetical protein GCM10010319_11260 [Streptomyces blastmyceticus]|uniref:Uncharacterized protein n=1 Tax=Streptomyces blastmyceticus TaxID=68180 RepID=A0ABN0WGK3_9ACTN
MRETVDTARAYGRTSGRMRELLWTDGTWRPRNSGGGASGCSVHLSGLPSLMGCDSGHEDWA